MQNTNSSDFVGKLDIACKRTLSYTTLNSDFVFLAILKDVKMLRLSKVITVEEENYFCNSLKFDI